MVIKTLIIDDEPLARKRIRQLLAGEAEFHVVGEGANAAEAASACAKLRPDLLFLDVQMPDGSGFDVLENIEQNALPAVVFVTASDQYTVKAFDFYAVDYLLKPFSEERFRRAAAKVRARLRRARGSEELNGRLRSLLADVKLHGVFLERLVVSHNNRLIIVPIAEVEWVAAFGNYLRVRSRGKTYLLRETINRLAERLDPEKFLRVHRSTIVNAECIKEFQAMFGGQYSIILKDNTEFVLSRTYRKEVLSRFEV